MGRSALAPDDTAEALERLLVVEEELVDSEGQLRAVEQGFNRLNFDTVLKERPLRRAIGALARDLTAAVASRDRGEGDQAKLGEQIKDLEFQVGQLENSCGALLEDQDAQLGDLNQELEDAGQQCELLREEAKELMRALGAQLRGLPSDDLPPEIQNLFSQLNAAERS